MVMNQFYGLTVTYVEASVLIALILEEINLWWWC